MNSRQPAPDYKELARKEWTGASPLWKQNCLGRGMFRIGNAVLSTARRPGCFFMLTNSGGQPQFQLL